MSERQMVCLELGSETKAQSIRLMDVFLIGPLMIWGGDALNKRGHKVAGTVLATFGLTTIFYNGHNYLKVRQRIREQAV